MKNYILSSVALLSCVVTSAQQEQNGIKEMCTLFERLQSHVELSKSDSEDACIKDIVAEQQKSNALSLQNHTVTIGKEKLLVNIADMTLCNQLFLKTLLDAAQNSKQASQRDRENIASMIEHLSGVRTLLDEYKVCANHDIEFLKENLLAILEAIFSAAKSE